MPLKESCNFFDLFETDIDGNYIARLDLKINNEVYKKGFIFEKNKKYSTFNISKNVDNFVLVDRKDLYIEIHMFTLSESHNRMFNSNIEEKLFRFGEFQYIKKALITGEFLIQSAIYYYATEHNEARRDNEHVYQKNISKNNVRIFNETQNQKVNLTSNIIQKNSNINLNQYILCTSYLYDEKLYDEFDANTCLVINNPEEFENRLRLEIQRKYPELIGVSNRVSYSKKQHFLGDMFTKRIDFIKQKEYRFLWLKNDSPQVMSEEEILTKKYFIPEPLKIKIGNIEDIAEIITKEKIIHI